MKYPYPMTRTTRSFTTPSEFWSKVEAWAPKHGYRSVASEGGSRTYQKGIGFWVAPMMLKLTESDGTVSMEAWIRAGTFVRIMSFFILPAEMGIESGGFKAMLPRNIARKAVNELLSVLEQPPIP